MKEFKWKWNKTIAHVQLCSWPKVQLPRFSRASLGKDHKYGATGGTKQFICKQSKKPIDEELIWTIITENKDHCSLFCFLFQDFCHPSFCTTIPGVDHLQLIRSTVRVENFEPYLYSGSVFKRKFLHLLSKFHGYIFIGFGEKWIWKLTPEIQ